MQNRQQQRHSRKGQRYRGQPQRSQYHAGNQEWQEPYWEQAGAPWGGDPWGNEEGGFQQYSQGGYGQPSEQGHERRFRGRRRQPPNFQQSNQAWGGYEQGGAYQQGGWYPQRGGPFPEGVEQRNYGRERQRQGGYGNPGQYQPSRQQGRTPWPSAGYGRERGPGEDYYDIRPRQGWSPASEFERHNHQPGYSGQSQGGEQTDIFGRSTGSHYGKGPKQYARSDERIKEDICDELYDDDDIDAQDVEVTVANGKVTLSGTVCERAMKHLAEDIASSARGVHEVANQIKVQSMSSQQNRSNERSEFGAGSAISGGGRQSKN